MKLSQQHYNIGVALVEALEPLIDVCLEAGITSPELESLLRVAFVLRTYERLPRHKNSGRPPTASKVTLASGVSWRDVQKILGAGGPIAAREKMQAKERTSSQSTRVIQGWTTDSKFLSSGGAPIDLSIKTNRERRSWEDLVDKYAPSTHAGSLLKEMVRRGQVQLIDGEIVRFKRATPKLSGITPSSVAEASGYIKQLSSALFASLSDASAPNVYEESDTIRLSTKKLALDRATLEQRTRAFLKSLEAEFPAKGDAVKDEDIDLGIGVYSWTKE